MDRSIFPAGVEVQASDLVRVEDTKAFHIQRRLVDSARPGIVSGLRVSVHSSPGSVFDVSAGWAYSPRGDLIELASPVTSRSLADYSTGVVNYVCLSYTTTATTARAHETNGQSYATQRVRSARLEVLSATAYAALANTSLTGSATTLDTQLKEADLAATDKSRLVLLATVTGKGFSAGTTPNTYTDIDVVQQTPFVDLRAVDVSPALQGLNVVSVSSSVASGAGEIELDVGSGTWTLAWQAPGDSYGSGVTVDPADGLVQTVTLQSSTSAQTITLEVYTQLLDRTDSGVYNSVVTVSNIYSDTGALFSPADLLHRSKQGAYVPTASDPHGSGDGQIVAVEDRPLVLGASNLGSTAAALLSRLVLPARATGGSAVRTLLAESSATGEKSLRLYTREDDVFELTINARWTTDSEWAKDTSTEPATKLTLTHKGFTERVHLISAATFAENAWLEVRSDYGLDDSGEAITRIGRDLVSSASTSARPRVEMPSSSSYRQCLLSTPNSDEITPVEAVRLFAETGYFELTSNAQWSGSQWSQDASGAASSRWVFGPGTVELYKKNSGAAPWATNAWSLVSTFALASSTLTLDELNLVLNSGPLAITGDVTATGNVEADNTPNARVRLTWTDGASPPGRSGAHNVSDAQYYDTNHECIVSFSPAFASDTYTVAWTHSMPSGGTSPFIVAEVFRSTSVFRFRVYNVSGTKLDLTDLEGEYCSLTFFGGK